ncbi:MAG TPA: DUF5985 family protein [Steroidobacteraceae bacterium]|jgi:hypothetical protein|nr:DUF5985 family protein [Steroidobacteraceae bacterium]
MAEFVYILCALTSCICAGLLLRAYLASRAALLFWSSICFIGLAINNALLLVDLYVVPDTDLFVLRAGIALAGVSALIYGLVTESH